MSREILYRGKRTDNGEWVEGWVTSQFKKHTEGELLTRIQSNVFGVGEHLVDTETVGEYTGLTDKNGKRIFEGDIIICKKEICGNFIDSCVEIGFVEMKHGAFGLHRKQGYYRPFKDWLEDYEYEIIGNIHDNPELLEVSE